MLQKSGNDQGVPNAIAGLLDQLAKLAEDQREQLRRIAKLGRRLAVANRHRTRLLHAADALLRKSRAQELRCVGAEEFDAERLELDTPFDGVLIALAMRYLPACSRLVQVVLDATPPKPIFAVETLDAELEYRVVDNIGELQLVDADIVVMDGRLINPTQPRLIGGSIRLIVIFPLGEAIESNSAPQICSSLACALADKGYDRFYVPPTCDYVIAWKVG